MITTDGGHIGRSHSSKKCCRKHYTFLHLCIKYFLELIKEDLLSTLCISAIQNTQIITHRVNCVGTTSAYDPASIFAGLQCGIHHLVYMRYLYGMAAMADQRTRVISDLKNMADYQE